MDLAHRWSDRNLTRLELIIALLLLTLMIGFALRHMLVFFARTEQIMVNTSLVNINSALKYHAVIALLRGDKKFISRLTERSPFSVIQGEQGLRILPAGSQTDELSARIATYTALPSNYLGELDGTDTPNIPAGSWYFDRSDKTLNYIVRNREFFYSDLSGIPRIKLKVVVDYNDIDGDGRFKPDIDKFESVSVQSVGYYSWTE